MGDGLLDIDNSMQDRQYTTPPNTSFATGLLNLLNGLGMNIEHDQKYAQPTFFGQDSMASGGESPSYPEFRTYNDYAEYNFPSPSIEQYTAFDGVFDEQGYNQAMMEYHNARSEHPQGTDW